MTTIFRRMFSKKVPSSEFAGIRRRMKLIQNSEPTDNFDPEDISEFEADFMNVGVSHKMHEREMRDRKERLKQQIVNQKYFKEKEPRFLTFAEKELVHKLHKSNPDEWTIEKLSESFPALPETIKKILRAKWLPKSVEKVLEYDDVVVKNWEKFRAGELPLSPVLNEHLMKFKDRKIILTDRELLAKQFVTKKEFKKPKSRLFSSIIQTYLDEKENDTKLLTQEDNLSKIADKSDYSKNQSLSISSTITDSPAAAKSTEKFAKLNKEQSLTLQLSVDSQKLNASFDKKKKKPLTFNEFVKVQLEDVHQNSLEEGIALLNVSRNQVDASNEEQTEQVAAAHDNAVIRTEEDSLKIVRRSDKDVLIAPKDKDKDFNIIGADENLLDTSIKVWKKKVDTDLNYVKPIKIAKHLYKPGMTYRITDCYYDDDGEFLYRVPGVYS